MYCSKNCYEASFSNTDERFIYDAKTGKLKTQTNDDKSNEIRRHKNTLLELEKEREYNEKLLTHAEICEESKCPDKRNYEKIKKRVAELDRKINYHKGQLSESGKDNQARPVKFVVDNEKSSTKLPEKSPSEGKRQTLIINLKSVKQITLTTDNNLVIEFNKIETNNNGNSVKEIQVINDKQIVSSQELQKVKNYLKESDNKSINQQELNSILANNTNSELTDKFNINDHIPTVGLSIIVVLTVGLATRLLIKRKLTKK